MPHIEVLGSDFFQSKTSVYRYIGNEILMRIFSLLNDSL